jgi:hypothetical protein
MKYLNKSIDILLKIKLGRKRHGATHFLFNYEWIHALFDDLKEMYSMFMFGWLLENVLVYDWFYVWVLQKWLILKI